MACEKYRDDDELLALFDSVFDKEIKDSRKRKLFAHLEQCHSCSTQYKLYEAMINGMERLEEVDAPVDLTAGVMAGIQSEPQPQWDANPLPFQRPHSTSWMWAGAFAVAFFLMVGTFVNWDGHQAPRVASLPPAATPVGNDVHLGEDRTQDELVAPQKSVQRVAGNPDLGIVLVQHQGDVEVLDLATNQWRAIHGQENLNFGDRVRTGNSGVASLEYRKEQVALRIKPQSTLQVLDKQTLRVYAGNTWVSVKKKGTIFRTETPNAIASVRGTKYSVDVKPLPSLYAEEAALALHRFLAPKSATPTHNAPAATANLGAYSTQLSLALLKTLSDPYLPARGNTKVNVYESVVEVVAKNAAGVSVSAIDVGEGFGSNVQLNVVAKPAVLTANDWIGWKAVMVYDQDVVSRANIQASAGIVTAPPAVTNTSGAGAGPTILQVAPVPPMDQGPASSSERPQGFDDINRGNR